MRKFVKSSSLILDVIKSYEEKEPLLLGVEKGDRFPWQSLPIGWSFIVNFSEVSLAALEKEAKRAGINYRREFMIVLNAESETYEVGRTDGVLCGYLEPTKYDKYQCSPQMAGRIETYEDLVGVSEDKPNAKYPWNSLGIGMCFVINATSEVEQSTLRTLVSSKGKALKKKFSVLKHEDQQIFEVARIG